MFSWWKHPPSSTQCSPALHVHRLKLFCFFSSSPVSFCCLSCVMLYFSLLIFWQDLLFSSKLTKKYDAMIPPWEQCGNKDREPLWTLRWKKQTPSHRVWWIYSGSIYSHIHRHTHTHTSTVKKSIVQTFFFFLLSNPSISTLLYVPFNFIWVILPLFPLLFLLCSTLCIKIPLHSLVPPPSIFWKQEWYTGFKLNSLSVSLIAC